MIMKNNINSCKKFQALEQGKSLLHNQTIDNPLCLSCQSYNTRNCSQNPNQSTLVSSAT
ncbi:MAG: hypothetical protein FWD82_00755 [Defluviitaleaceae bacterium]|nr:hypothetical protein [Defluviitaleaceae bacterium]